MTITNDSLNLLYGYGTLTYYGLMDYEYSVSISYMGMERPTFDDMLIILTSLNLLYGYGTENNPNMVDSVKQKLSLNLLYGYGTFIKKDYDENFNSVSSQSPIWVWNLKR